MEINNVNDLSKIMQPVLVGLVDQLANRVYETLNFFLQSYYDSYNPVSYRRQYDFLRSAIKVKGRMSRGKAVAYVYIDTESMSNYYNATGYQVATWANEGLHGGLNVGTSPHVWDETLTCTIEDGTLLKEAISRAKEIIEQKNPELENKEEVAKKVGIGAVIFNDLSASRIKDEVFDWDTILNFQGETGPYIQYTYVRTKSVLEKAEYLPKIEEVKAEILTDECSQDILKLIYNFQDILVQVTEKNEPSILARYLIDLAKAYSSFYNENKIIVEDKEVQNARVYLTYATSEVLKQGAKLLGIEMPEKM